ncbi:MAG TPA: hypothetical protein VHS59_11945 [Bacillota bacterium]|nr:hypothetical protein [Bacillota bacterium]
MFQILIIINNYFHDVATALLAGSGLLIFAAYRLLPENPGPETQDFFLRLYHHYTRIARVALAWIILGGIPRLIYFKKIEWTIALDNRIIPSLMVKHILLVAVVVVGLVSWRRLSRKVRAMEAGKNE